MTNHLQHQQHQQHQQHHWQPTPTPQHDSGHWKGFDGYKDASGKPYDSGHWKGHDAYPPHHQNQHHQQQDHVHWHQPIYETRGSPVPEGQSTIVPIQDSRPVPDHLQGYQWQGQPTQGMHDKQGNVLSPGDFSTLPAPDQLATQHPWEQTDPASFVPADGQGVDGSASTVSWEPIQGVIEAGQGGNEFSIMPITLA